MVKIYSHLESTVIYLLKNVLENSGIECEIKNERLSTVLGHYQPFSTWVELWILDDSRQDEAKQIIEEALSDEEEPSGESWKCQKCGEESESQFTECWNCGESRLD